MDNAWGQGQNNLCYDYDPPTAGHEDHFHDNVETCTPPQTNPIWPQIGSAGLVPWLPTETPDDFNYRNFDFNFQICNVIVH